MTDEPIVQTPATQPVPASETRPIVLDPRGCAPVVAVARVLLDRPSRRSDPRIRTR